MSKHKELLLGIGSLIALSLLVFFYSLSYGWTNPSGNPPTGTGAISYSGGNVGVGTTTPSQLFTVATTTNIFMVNSTGTVVIGSSTLPDYFKSKLLVETQTGLNSSEAIWIRSYSRIGMAIDQVSSSLHNLGAGIWINSSAGGAEDVYGIRVNSVGGGTDNNYGIYIGPTGGLGESPVLTIASSSWALFSASLEKSYFEGSLGIGTSTPHGKLQVLTSNDTTPGTVTDWDSRHAVFGNTGRLGAVGISYDRTNNLGIIQALSPSIAYRNLILQGFGGNVGIGTTAPGAKLSVKGRMSVYPSGSSEDLGYTGGLVVSKPVTSSALINLVSVGNFVWSLGHLPSSNTFALFSSVAVGGTAENFTPTLGLRVDTAGNLSVGSGTTGCVRDYDATTLVGTCASDARLKNIVNPLTGALEKVAQLQPQYFYWKENNPEEYGGGIYGNKQKNLGLIAQDAEKLIPELVATDLNGFKTVNYGAELQMWTIQAVKELKAENDGLKAENQALIERIIKIEAKLGISQ